MLHNVPRFRLICIPPLRRTPQSVLRCAVLLHFTRFSLTQEYGHGDSDPAFYVLPLLAIISCGLHLRAVNCNHLQVVWPLHTETVQAIAGNSTRTPSSPTCRYRKPAGLWDYYPT